jgi:hypothetical protein
MTLHKTKIVSSKAFVDRRIIPLVTWLNTYKSVVTMFSCEGFPKNHPLLISPNGGGEAYVMFTANQKDLKSILTYVRKFIYKFNGRTHPMPVVEVDFLDPSIPLRYSLKFPNRDEMLIFTGFVSERDKHDEAQAVAESCVV